MSSVVLTPVTQAGHWRVKIAWPGKTPHYFGRFNSQAEAEQWIADHHWMTEQRQEPGADEPEAADDPCQHGSIWQRPVPANTKHLCRNESRSPDLARVGANVGNAPMLWKIPIGPKSKEAAILRRVMQEAIGDELRAQYAPSVELPHDLRRLVNEIDGQRE
jgi:hypothetical protein